MVHVLVTGGVGFIGSHTVIALLEGGHTACIVDDLSNSFPRVFDHMARIAGPKASSMKFYKADVCDKEALDKIFEKEKPDAVIHFAGFKAVGESMAKPLMYYRNNIESTIVLLECMEKHDCNMLVFSSSATVYGMPQRVPLTEDHPLGAINPYGKTKQFQEEIFRDCAAANPKLRVLLLRYFNPVGAHPTGLIGEHPVGIPNNLSPFVMQVALGQREFLRVFGDDYDTSDGTAVRDYIHIMDLADGHVAALNKLAASPEFGCQAVNLGTGKGTSVLEMIRIFEEATGAKVPYKVAERRPGDAPVVYAGTDLAESMLGWRASRGVAEMCSSLWKWATQFPQGYETPEAPAEGGAA